MIRRRVAAAIAAAILLASSGGASAQRPRPSIRVLVFNVHAGKDAGGGRNMDGVAALVRSSNADIVLLQEVDRGTRRSGNVDQLQVLEDLTKYSAVFGRSLDYDGGQYGIAALARQRIEQSATEPLPIQPPQARAGGSYEPRVALTFATSTSLGALLVLNTHLDASSDEHYRVQESAHILAMLKRMAVKRLFVAGGDFNAEPGSATYEQVVSGGLKDAWRECGKGDGFTYPAVKPVKRIDYLFLARDLRCTSAEVIDTRVSDHRPLLVTLTRR
jgi:endonuclease/exonuclease/phosphatase family metal-dependent hydrolase